MDRTVNESGDKSVKVLFRVSEIHLALRRETQYTEKTEDARREKERRTQRPEGSEEDGLVKRSNRAG